MRFDVNPIPEKVRKQHIPNTSSSSKGELKVVFFAGKENEASFAHLDNDYVPEYHSIAPVHSSCYSLISLFIFLPQACLQQLMTQRWSGLSSKGFVILYMAVDHQTSHGRLLLVLWQLLLHQTCWVIPVCLKTGLTTVVCIRLLDSFGFVFQGIF